MPSIREVMPDYAPVYRLASEHGHDAGLCIMRVAVLTSLYGTSPERAFGPCDEVAELFIEKSEPRA